jgi:hypothetical protein
MNRQFGVMLLVAMVAGGAGAQSAKIVTPHALTFNTNDNSARIGVYLGENGIRDTLGVLVNSVVEDGPAAKAGIKEGDRIQSIGGVNLKMSRDDADDSALGGMMSRRLTRELDKMKPGDDVDLRVFSGGATRSVRVKTVAARELSQSTTRRAEVSPTRMGNDRAALGISLGGSISKRDTLGVFVVSVTPDGPADKAGIIEGDRIARINTMDLRVPGTDAGDPELARARMRRFTQEIGKLSAGDVATLTVVSGGRQREVRVTSVKSSELHGGDGFGFFFGDGAFSFPNFEMPNLKVLPRGGSSFEIPNGAFYFRDGDGKLSEEIRTQIDRAMEQARKSLNEVRVAPGGSFYYRGADGDIINKDVREQVQRSLERARSALEKARVESQKSKSPLVKRTVIRS